MEKVQVNASRKYDIYIGNNLLAHAGEYISRVHEPCKAFIVTDKTVKELYSGTVTASLSAAGFEVYDFAFDAGEGSKNMETISNIVEEMAEKQFTRGDLIVALGGGIAGDVAGFAASVFLRGIPFVQIPTTLLAAVDSSVGGKTGVNLKSGKNLAGAFWQPSLVLCDCDTFKTLPYETFLDGIAEAVKYGVISDAELFNRLYEAGEKLYSEQDNLIGIVKRCVSIKADIVMKDERDTGLRQLLNLGHTIGHAVEKASGYEITHGHAVALGMLMISKACADMGICKATCHSRISDILSSFGFPSASPFSAEVLLDAMLKDKKRSGNTITLVLPKEIGRCVLEKVPVERLAQFIGNEQYINNGN